MTGLAMNGQEKAQLIEKLLAIRSEGLTLAKKVQTLIKPAPEGVDSSLVAACAKLDAFDALITMATDELRDDI